MVKNRDTGHINLTIINTTSINFSSGTIIDGKDCALSRYLCLYVIDDTGHKGIDVVLQDNSDESELEVINGRPKCRQNEPFINLNAGESISFTNAYFEANYDNKDKKEPIIGLSLENAGNDKIYVENGGTNTGHLSTGAKIFYDKSKDTILKDGGNYVLKLTTSTFNDDSGGDDSGGSSGSSSGKSYPSSDPTGSVHVDGFDSNNTNKDKQIELMHIAILPYCTDPYLYTTHYFKFDHIDETNKKYIFIETKSQQADDVYCIKGPYADLGLMKYENNSNIPGYEEDQDYNSKPEFATFDDSKSNLKMFLQSLQETGNEAGRELLYDINFGRVRPLGNKQWPSKEHRINNKIGNKWNGIVNTSLMCRYAENIDKFNSVKDDTEIPGDKPTSYPSGHSSQFYSLSLGLAHLYGLSNDMNNARKYMHIGYKIGIQRSLGRWHWHSDILYGKLLGTMVLPILNASNNFRTYYIKAYKELTGKEFPVDDLIDASTLNFEDASTEPFKGYFEDFKKLVNKIVDGIITGLTWREGSENETVWKYLWWMYKIGRTAADGISFGYNGHNLDFNFFNNTNYKNGNIESSDDIDNWFPEVFPDEGRKITPNKNGTSITVKLHGTRTEYRRGIDRSNSSDKPTLITSVIDTTKNLTNHEILCSWLMACCLSEIYCNYDENNNGNPENPNNQTKIFEAAYIIGGGRSLNLYDEYALDHDPMYLRLAAGIIYAYCRGKFNDNIRSDKFSIYDVTGDDITNKDDVNAIIGNDAERIQWRDKDGYISGDQVKWGVDSYYIFPNAPGPYNNGRGALAKPYEQKPIGSTFLQSQSQSQTLFITD